MAIDNQVDDWEDAVLSGPPLLRLGKTFLSEPESLVPIRAHDMIELTIIVGFLMLACDLRRVSRSRT